MEEGYAVIRVEGKREFRNGVFETEEKANQIVRMVKRFHGPDAVVFIEGPKERASEQEKVPGKGAKV